MESQGRIDRGFTVAELMITLGIAAVLATLATPGFQDLRRNAALSTAANQMLWALHYARSAAILRGLPTAVCLTSNGSSCATGIAASAHGWLVFHDVERGGATQIAGPDELLHSFTLPPDVEVKGSRTAVMYWPTTRAGTTSTFTICDSQGHPQGRAVIVSQTGRPRVAGETPCAP